jgi:hypothetical protein
MRLTVTSFLVTMLIASGSLAGGSLSLSEGPITVGATPTTNGMYSVHVLLRPVPEWHLQDMTLELDQEGASALSVPLYAIRSKLPHAIVSFKANATTLKSLRIRVPYYRPETEKYRIINISLSDLKEQATTETPNKKVHARTHRASAMSSA